MELKSCPFCNARAKIEHSTRNEFSERGLLMKSSERYRIICVKCGCGTQWLNQTEQAIDLWNGRTDDKG